jgi:hypothetical protein
MDFERIIFRVHAVQRMFERDVSEVEIRDILENGEVIELENGVALPSRIMLGFPNGRPLHVVACDNPDERAVVVITVYEPSPFIWDSTFKKHR